MPSPFPGMDPWLESPSVFPDFHTRFINRLSDQLNELLPPPFYTGVSTRIWLEGSERRVEPDVDVLKPSNGSPTGSLAQGGGVATLAEPNLGLLEIVSSAHPDEEMTETFIELFAAPGGKRLIASIELLSPSNKTPGSGGRDLYRAKQQEMFQAGVHLIEIDLLRSGTHATLIPLRLLKRSVNAFDYHICLHRADRRQSYFVAAMRLADRLPIIPVPLTPDVPSVQVDLKSVLDRCYDAGNYSRRVRYNHPVEPPLNAEWALWAQQVLREKGIA